jgi:hypothetical protein
VRFIVAALANRVPEAQEDAKPILAMVKRFNEALTETRRIAGDRSQHSSSTRDR